jgi:hypothetical protein
MSSRGGCSLAMAGRGEVVLRGWRQRVGRSRRSRSVGGCAAGLQEPGSRVLVLDWGAELPIYDCSRSVPAVRKVCGGFARLEDFSGAADYHSSGALFGGATVLARSARRPVGGALGVHLISVRCRMLGDGSLPRFAILGGTIVAQTGIAAATRPFGSAASDAQYPPQCCLEI